MCGKLSANINNISHPLCHFGPCRDLDCSSRAVLVPDLEHLQEEAPLSKTLESVAFESLH